MSIWQTLDISPTRDESEIRRAYARQLKKYRPDSDPVGYQQLREAFDTAKRLVMVDGEPVGADNRTTIIPQWEAPVTQAHIAMALPETETFYSTVEMRALAYQLVHAEMMGIVRLNQLWAKISDQGSLLQQQLFHQHLADALSEVKGLTEGLIERVAGLLEWGMDEYDYSHIIPLPIQHSLQERMRETEVNRAWKQMEVEEKHGTILEKVAIRLLKSEQKNVPFWVRLVPGMLQTLARQANSLMHYYPEFSSRFNPALLQFLSQTRLGLSWQGVFLLVFWGLLFNAVIPVSGIGTVVSVIAIATVVFYLYLSDMIMMGLHGKARWVGGFLFAEFIFSLMVIQLFFGGLFFAAVISMPPSGHGGKVLAAWFTILVLFLIFWAAWPKGVPFIRKPGIVMSRIFASPWSMLEWMNFAWFSAVWVILYFAICVLVIVELLKLFV
ncbi:J domain-containing protein [Pseudomonas lundensis]|uniref:J domain-containing protein n=1 Tax=Serratia proteamaculans TaxID=28151 RepID=UPI0029818A33|nr:J domain-containing protein [Serratia proteamaculans]MDW5499817.1 J domain-containing protein [Serratia proteamaculans]MDW5504882.1 J domain-containing protein [Pseudomonas lundensis]